MAVLAMLSAALWAVRRYDIRLPGRIGGGAQSRLGISERIGIDARRSLLIVRRDQREFLLLIAPEGNMLLDEAAQEPETASLPETNHAVPMPPPPSPHCPVPFFPLRRRMPRHDPIPMQSR